MLRCIGSHPRCRPSTAIYRHRAVGRAVILSILAFIVEQVHQVVGSEEIHCGQTEQQRSNK